MSDLNVNNEQLIEDLEQIHMNRIHHEHSTVQLAVAQFELKEIEKYLKQKYTSASQYNIIDW